MKKISKILDSNTAVWKKMFEGLKVVAGGWLAREVLREGINAFIQFTDRGITAAQSMKEHAAAANEFRQRQAELNTEISKFAGEVVGPLLPGMNDLLVGMRGLATTTASAARYVHELAASMPEIPAWVPGVGALAAQWRSAAMATAEYANQVRAADEQRKQMERDALVDGLPTEEDMKVDDERMRQVEARAEVQRKQKIARGKVLIADMVAQERQREQVRVELERAAYEAEHQRALERGRLADDLRAQTDLGRRQLIEENALRDLAMTDWTEAERIRILKAYGKQERALTQARYATQMNIATAGMGALTQLLGATLGENHKITKSFAIAEALVNTYAGVTQALRFYPPPQSWIMAAASLAMGIKQVQAIKATAPGTGGGGGSVGGGSYSTQGSVPTSEPAATPATTEKQRDAGKFEVHIYNPVGERAWFEQNIVPLFTEARRNRSFDAEVFAQ
jgi:hypothetical protein